MLIRTFQSVILTGAAIREANCRAVEGPLTPPLTRICLNEFSHYSLTDGRWNNW